MTDGPWSFDDARDASAKASRAQHAAEQFVREAYKKVAEAEGSYRVELAKKIVELRAAGNAATLCKDLARGDSNVARLKAESLIAEGVKEAAVHAAWRRAADRRQTEGFCEWSMRRELAEGFGRAPEPADSRPIGSRRAA